MSKAGRGGSGDRRRGGGAAAGVVVRLSLFAVVLAVVFVAALGVGAAVGPLDDTPEGAGSGSTTEEPTDSDEHDRMPAPVESTTTTTTMDPGMDPAMHGGGS